MSTTYEKLDDIEERGGQLPLDYINFIPPGIEDIEDEISFLEGFRDHSKEIHSEDLTFGDY